MIKLRYFQALCLLMMLCHPRLPAVPAQELVTEQSQTTSGKKRLLILPTRSNKDIDKEVTSIITSMVTRLGRFEVIDRNNLQVILQEQALQLSGVINDSMLVKIGDIATAREALLVTVLNFSQRGVPKSSDKDTDETEIIEEVAKVIFKENRKEGKQDPYPGNIQTQLSVHAKMIDVESSQTLRSFKIDVAHTGGSLQESRSKALAEFAKKADIELRKLYLIVSEVVSVDGMEALLLLGNDIGLKSGTVFVIMEPEQTRTIRERTIKLPGRQAAFVSVEDVSSELNRSVILRQWGSIQPGNIAIEHVRSIYGLQLNFLPSLHDSFYSIDLQFLARAIRRRRWGGAIRFLQITDSFGTRDSGFGLGVFGAQRLLAFSKSTVLFRIGVDLDFITRKDDAEQGVGTAVFSSCPSLNAEFVVSKRADIVIGAGYRIGSELGTWSRTSGGGEEAIWNDGAPVVDLSGVFVSVGYKLILY